MQSEAVEIAVARTLLRVFGPVVDELRKIAEGPAPASSGDVGAALVDAIRAVVQVPPNSPAPRNSPTQAPKGNGAVPGLEHRERSDAKLIEFRGERLSISGWAKRLGTSRSVIKARIAKGLPLDLPPGDPQAGRKRKREAASGEPAADAP